MRQGLAEWVVVTAVLLLAATAASLRWGGDVRAAFGVAPPARTLPRSSR